MAALATAEAALSALLLMMEQEGTAPMELANLECLLARAAAATKRLTAASSCGSDDPEHGRCIAVASAVSAEVGVRLAPACGAKTTHTGSDLSAALDALSLGGPHVSSDSAVACAPELQSGEATVAVGDRVYFKTASGE